MSNRLGSFTARAVEIVTGSRVFGLVLFFLLIFGLVLFVHNSTDKVSARSIEEISTGCLALGFASVCAAYLNRFLFWNVLSSGYGLRADTACAARAFFLSILGRYVPGKAGLFLFRLRAYQGGTRSRVGAALITEYLSTFAASSFLVVIGSFFAPVHNPLLTRVIPIVFIALVSVAIHPTVLRMVINKLLHLLKKEELSVFPPRGLLIKVTAGYCLTGLLHGLGLFILLSSLCSPGWLLYPTVTGAYYLAGIIGIFTFFAPGGVGVREGVMFLLLPCFLPLDCVVAGAVAMRLITLAAELFLYLVSEIAARFNGKERYAH